MKNISKKFVLVFVLVSLALFLISATRTEKDEEFHKQLKNYTTALALIEENYPGEVDMSELIEGSIQRMLQTLDAHSSYANPEAYQRMQEDHDGYFFGIGISIAIRNQRVTVLSLIDGGPAYKLGIRAGDLIDTIAGKSTVGMSLNQAVSILRGPEGEPVDITIRRSGVSTPLKYSIVREKITENAVPYAFMADDKTGYVKMVRFSRTSEREMKEAVEKLLASNMKRLVLDLRDNPGGLLTQAINVSNIFVDKGIIVSIRGREKKDKAEFSAKKKAMLTKIPLVVLVNDNSASASEIVAGAIQDYDRGLLVGESTFGKGLVQSTFPLSNGGAMYLTTAKYYTPSGRLIQRKYTGIYDYYVDRRLNGEKIVLPEGEPYFTKLGRKVFSGQGISPDIQEEGNFNTFIGRLLVYSHIFNFAGEYVAKNPNITKDLMIDDEIIEQLKGYLKEKKFEYEPKEFEKNIIKIKYRLADDIFTRKWDRVSGVKKALEFDKQYRKAVESFSEANSLLAKSMKVKTKP